MFCIRIERILEKDIESVFHAISDHNAYDQFPGIDESILLEGGQLEKNGLGALRCIRAGKFNVVERITRFDPPWRIDYHIESAKPIPMQHDIGHITLSKVGEKTRVVWISEGHLKVPIIGTLFLDRILEKQAARTFSAILKSISDS